MEADTDPKSHGIAAGSAARMLRTARAHRRLSQRELADRAGVARSSIDRIESGAVSPRVVGLEKILAAAGCSLALLDHRGRPIACDELRDDLHDRAGRRFPAHLPSEKVNPYFGPELLNWWGWHRIARPLTKDWVPEHTYWHPRTPGRPWDDAT